MRLGLASGDSTKPWPFSHGMGGYQTVGFLSCLFCCCTFFMGEGEGGQTVTFRQVKEKLPLGLD